MIHTKKLCGIAVTALLILFTSCDKDKAASVIVGTWTAVSEQYYAKGELWQEMNYEKQERTYYYDGEAVETEPVPYIMTLTITDDGKYVSLLTVNEGDSSETEPDNGTYELVQKGDDLYISLTGNDGDSMEMLITALSDHLLKLRFEDEEASIDGESLNYTIVSTFKR